MNPAETKELYSLVETRIENFLKTGNLDVKENIWTGKNTHKPERQAVKEEKIKDENQLFKDKGNAEDEHNKEHNVQIGEKKTNGKASKDIKETITQIREALFNFKQSESEFDSEIEEIGISDEEGGNVETIEAVLSEEERELNPEDDYWKDDVANSDSFEEDTDDPLKENHHDEEQGEMTNLSDHNSEQDKATSLLFSNICMLCYVGFSTKPNLESHMKINHAEDKEALKGPINVEDLAHNCTMCPLKFLTQHILEGHKKSQHRMLSKLRAKKPNEEMNFKCKLCYKEFLNKSSLEHHVKIHKEDQNAFSEDLVNDDLGFHCSESGCELRFVSEHTLKYHTNTIHRDVENKMLRKLTFDSTQNKFTCPLCYSTVKTFGAMCKHINNMHINDKDILTNLIRSEDLVIQCEKCDSKFLKESFLAIHDERKHRVVEKILNCSICKKKMSKHHLRRHMMTVHTAERKFACKLCYTKFKTKKYVKQHYKSVHKHDEAFLSREISEEDCIFKCSVCDLRFVTEKILGVHETKHNEVESQNKNTLKLKHGKSTRYCQLCNAIFKKSSIFRRHTQNVHNVHPTEMEALNRRIDKSELIHGCKKCDSHFLTQNILDYHMRKKHWHYGTKDHTFSCILCHTNYPNSHKYNKHINSKHTNMQEALIIKQGFIESNKLTVKCESCDRMLLTELILAHHKRFVHKEGYSSVGFKTNRVKLEKNDRVCNLCNVTFKIAFKLDIHRETVHSKHPKEMAGLYRELKEEELTEGCNKCNSYFLTQNILNYHMKKFHNFRDAREAGTSQCILCATTYVEVRTYEKHIQVHHTSEEERLALEIGYVDESRLQFYCSSCDKRFLSERIKALHSKRMHKKANNASLPKDSTCRLCQVEFRDSHKQRAHVKKVHKTPEEIVALTNNCENIQLNHKCHFCEIHFFTRKSMKLHIRRIHRDVVVWKCDQCPKMYPKSKERNRHIKIHMQKQHGVPDINRPEQVNGDTFNNFAFMMSVLNESR